MCLYWIANATFAGVQTLCINPAARSTLKRWVTFSKKEVIPPPPKEVKRVVKSESGGASASASVSAAKVTSESKENVDALLKDVKSSVFKDK